jgi:hypothetical protein
MGRSCGDAGKRGGTREHERRRDDKMARGGAWALSASPVTSRLATLIPTIGKRARHAFKARSIGAFDGVPGLPERRVDSWTHRLLHHRALFRGMHRVHHLSTNPTPWAPYSFNIGEAYVQAGIGPLLLYTMAMHYSAFVAFMTWQIAFNVIGHCGYEIFPR